MARQLHVSARLDRECERARRLARLCRTQFGLPSCGRSPTLAVVSCASCITATASTDAAARACSRASTTSAIAQGPDRHRLSPAWSTRATRRRSRPTPSTATRTPASTSATRRTRACRGGSTTTRPPFSCRATRRTSAPTPPGASSTTRRRRAARSSSPTPWRRSSASTSAPLRELVDWAEIIDGALFPDAADGGRAQGAGAAAHDVHREQPRSGARPSASSAISSRARWPTSRPTPYVTEPLGPLLEQHRAQHRRHPQGGQARGRRRATSTSPTRTSAPSTSSSPTTCSPRRATRSA